MHHDSSPSSVPPGALSLHLLALGERIDRELPRNGNAPAPSTEIVGGWSKLGARLDGLLRAVFETLCQERGLDPAATWQQRLRSPWDRVTAGAVVHALNGPLSDFASVHSVVRPLLDDLRAPRSVLRDAIMCRNALIHERRSPPPAALVAALRALRDLVSSLPQGVGDH